ncbi:MAG: hypothetical protein EOM26_10425 [Alphaproteobacteria bacterium]|nr:hypothetical protein [Alphaproteobacteria bacterium]
MILDPGKFLKTTLTAVRWTGILAVAGLLAVGVNAAIAHIYSAPGIERAKEVLHHTRITGHITGSGLEPGSQVQINVLTPKGQTSSIWTTTDPKGVFLLPDIDLVDPSYEKLEVRVTINVDDPLLAPREVAFLLDKRLRTVDVLGTGFSEGSNFSLFFGGEGEAVSLARADWSGSFKTGPVGNAPVTRLKGQVCLRYEDVAEPGSPEICFSQQVSSAGAFTLVQGLPGGVDDVDEALDGISDLADLDDQLEILSDLGLTIEDLETLSGLSADEVEEWFATVGLNEALNDLLDLQSQIADVTMFLEDIMEDVEDITELADLIDDLLDADLDDLDGILEDLASGALGIDLEELAESLDFLSDLGIDLNDIMTLNVSDLQDALLDFALDEGLDALTDVLSDLDVLDALSDLGLSLGDISDLVGLGGGDLTSAVTALLGGGGNLRSPYSTWTRPGDCAPAGTTLSVCIPSHIDWWQHTEVDTYVHAIMAMTQQFSVLMVQQAQVIGAFFDAKEQLEVQRWIQMKSAEAHRDYHPSYQICYYGTFSQDFTNLMRATELSARALNSYFLDREIGPAFQQGGMPQGSGAPASQAQDYLTRLQQFRTRYCDSDENGPTGLELMCDEPAPAHVSDDINYTRFSSAKTLDIDFEDTGNTDTETDLLAMGKYLFAHEVLSRPSQADIYDDTNDIRLEGARALLDMRTVSAIRSVIRDSFSQITALKTPGAGLTTQFVTAYLEGMDLDADAIEELIGPDPSEAALLNVLMVKMPQNPNFYTETYDTETNVERVRAAMQAVDNMGAREAFESVLRREMTLSMRLELRLRDLQDDVDSDIQRAIDNMTGTAGLTAP